MNNNNKTPKTSDTTLYPTAPSPGKAKAEKKRELSPRQQRFIEEYLIDLNGTQAAIRAGYSQKTAQEQACYLLSNIRIARAVQELKDLRSQRVQLDADYVLKNLQSVAERCLQAEPVVKWDKGERAYVQVQDDEGRNVWQFDSNGANRALELIGKHKGMFIERQQIDLNIIAPLAERLQRARQRTQDPALLPPEEEEI